MKKYMTALLCGVIGVSSMMISAKPVTAVNASGFSDVPVSFWAKQAIDTSVAKGYFKGLPDGTFKPKNSVSRAEFAALMSRVSDNVIVEGKGEFADLQGHWSQQEVNTAIAKGIIDVKDYATGFKPNTEITRYEMSKWMTSALATKDADYKKALSDTKDTVIPIVEYYKGGIVKSQYPYVSVALGTGLISGYPDGKFGLQGKATRAEAATILLRYESVQTKAATDFVGLNELREVGLTGTNVTSFTPFRYRRDGMSFTDIIGKDVKMRYDVADIKVYRMIVLDIEKNATSKSIYTSMFLDWERDQDDDYTAMVEMTIKSKKDKLGSDMMMSSNSQSLAIGGAFSGNAPEKYGVERMTHNNVNTYLLKGVEQRLWTTSGFDKENRYSPVELETKDGSEFELTIPNSYK
ncbi:S-layer homology domain-containing protein [Paenibacillus glacialis]|uniref:SLH domain-containing protein n=1 Tax=Paenibacillus glacialis TaxID=494026 RepID=A0A168HRS5_9BACL|nr:S-layer homology domain-containing protein [Paenibacillus glacialis]OAB38462.1 hypothetical protein PGLA_20440 [Paenibacillus glacialis]